MGEGCYITLFSLSCHSKRFPVTSLRSTEKSKISEYRYFRSVTSPYGLMWKITGTTDRVKSADLCGRVFDPSDRKRRPGAGTMLVHHLRRWPSIEPAPGWPLALVRGERLSLNRRCRSLSSAHVTSSAPGGLHGIKYACRLKTRLYLILRFARIFRRVPLLLSWRWKAWNTPQKHPCWMTSRTTGEPESKVFDTIPGTATPLTISRPDVSAEIKHLIQCGITVSNALKTWRATLTL